MRHRSVRGDPGNPPFLLIGLIGANSTEAQPKGATGCGWNYRYFLWKAAERFGTDALVGDTRRRARCRLCRSRRVRSLVRLTDVVATNLSTNIENSYLANLDKVAIFIERGLVQAAIQELNAFIQKVNQDYAQGTITLAKKTNLSH
jgi:hypothetical protein